MDFDPEVEELDSFSLILPLPYRLAILIVLGVWLWGLNLHGLHLLKIVGRFALQSGCSCTDSHSPILGHTILDTIPYSFFAFSCTSPQRRLLVRDCPHNPTRRVAALVLDPHTQ